jgi:hypothetical protein
LGVDMRTVQLPGWQSFFLLKEAARSPEKGQQLFAASNISAQFKGEKKKKTFKRVFTTKAYR